MNQIRFLILVAVGLQVLFPATGNANDPCPQSLEPIETGNHLYMQKQYDQALQCYNRASQELQNEPRVHFNRGDALFKLRRYQEAQQAFLLATSSQDPELRKKIFFNLGNTFLSKGEFDEAATHYRRALEIDPRYDDARFNLELALRAIRQPPEKPINGSTDQNPSMAEQDRNQKNQPVPEHEKTSSAAEKLPQDSVQTQHKLPRQKPPSMRLSEAQMQNLLNALRENEKPFQMSLFASPRLKQKDLEKDW